VQNIERFRAIGRFLAVKPGAGEGAHQQPTAHRVVIYYQYFSALVIAIVTLP
jgi:hypothetical protein